MTGQAILARIVEQSDYPGEAAERVMALYGITFGDALELVWAESERAHGDPAAAWQAKHLW